MIALWLVLAASTPCDDASLRTPPGDDAAQERVLHALQPLGVVRLDELSDRATAIARAEARLDALCHASVALAAPATPVRGELASVLGDPEFAHARERGADPSWFLRRIRAWLDALFGLRSAQRYAAGARFVVLVAAFTSVLIAVLLLRRRLQGRSGGSRTAPLEGPARLEEPETHLARATTLLPMNPRESLREACLALLSSLEKHQLARPDRVRTNRELLRELPSRGAPAPVTAAVTRLLEWYDRAFYSLAPVTAEVGREFLEGVKQVVDALPGQAVPGVGGQRAPAEGAGG